MEARETGVPSDIACALASSGFDIMHAFDAAAAATRVQELGPLAGPARMGLLIGNTRALWPVFSAALRDPSLAAEADPLDRYTERMIGAVFPTARIFYSHRRHGGSYLPFQRLADATGLGALAPSHLVIHPVYGPWFALRALVLVDRGIDGDAPVRAPIPRACSCDASCEAAFAAAQRSAEWRDWLAVRDSCSLRAWRYTDDQIAFHYAALAKLAGLMTQGS